MVETKLVNYFCISNRFSQA